MINNTKNVTHTKRASTKEIVMFIFACAILIAALMLLALPTAMEKFDFDNAEQSDALDPAAWVIAFMLVMQYMAIIGIVLMVFLAVAWFVGMLLCVKLIRRKKQIPTWLYIGSLILAVLYSLGLIALICAWTLS